MQFHFESRACRTALEEISQGLQRGEPIIVITGAAGTGKTTLCRLIEERRDQQTLVARINTPPRDVGDLLRQVLHAFGVLTGDASELVKVTHSELLRTLHRFLRSLVPLNAQAVVVFDEAQLLNLEMLEQIQLLSNLHIDGNAQLLRIILVGQPDLEDQLASPDLRQVAQRISTRHRLQPLHRSEVAAYISHRLRGVQSGGTAESRLSAGALRAIASLSEGVPRVVNTLCDRVLESASEDRTHSIDEARVVRVGRSLNLDVPSTVRVRIDIRSARVAAVAAMVLAAAFLLWMREAGTSVAAGPIRPPSVVTGAAATTMPVVPPPPQTTSPNVEKANRSPIAPIPKGAAPASPSRAKPAVKLEDASLQDLLDRAVVLRQQPNVKALQQISDEIVRRQHAAPQDASGEFDAAVARLDTYLAEARRRQLEEDGRRLGALAR